MIEQRVGARRDLDCSAGEALCFDNTALPGEDLGSCAQETDRRLQVVTTDRGVRKVCRLVETIELEKSACEQRRRPGRADAASRVR